MQNRDDAFKAAQHTGRLWRPHLRDVHEAAQVYVDVARMRCCGPFAACPPPPQDAPLSECATGLDAAALAAP